MARRVGMVTLGLAALLGCGHVGPALAGPLDSRPPTLLIAGDNTRSGTQVVGVIDNGPSSGRMLITVVGLIAGAVIADDLTGSEVWYLLVGGVRPQPYLAPARAVAGRVPPGLFSSWLVFPSRLVWVIRQISLASVLTMVSGAAITATILNLFYDEP
ncbi:exported hypothetical protein [uncultured Gammaproteobacteria bacterium]